jgi:predicted restriction endonuclease
MARVKAKRGDGFAPYLNKDNYEKTMYQFVQQHCDGYKKFNGDIQFVKVRRGRFRLASHSSTVPERHRLPPENIHPETVPEGKKYVTGAVRQVLINAYERDPGARKACIQRHGTTCLVCGLNFEEQYGPIGKGFIHVHHRKPLATREIYRLDPINDLVPVCPNCHCMLHSSEPPLSIEQLKVLRAKQGLTLGAADAYRRR